MVDHVQLMNKRHEIIIIMIIFLHQSYLTLSLYFSPPSSIPSMHLHPLPLFLFILLVAEATVMCVAVTTELHGFRGCAVREFSFVAQKPGCKGLRITTEACWGRCHTWEVTKQTQHVNTNTHTHTELTHTYEGTHLIEAEQSSALPLYFFRCYFWKLPLYWKDEKSDEWLMTQDSTQTIRRLMTHSQLRPICYCHKRCSHPSKLGEGGQTFTGRVLVCRDSNFTSRVIEKPSLVGQERRQTPCLRRRKALNQQQVEMTHGGNVSVRVISALHLQNKETTFWGLSTTFNDLSQGSAFAHLK